VRFTWDPAKDERNIAKHGLAFAQALLIFDGPVVTRRSDRQGEERYVAVGQLPDSFGSRIIAVAYHDRDEVRRIISARGSRTHEKCDYQRAIGQREAR
jgi:uncharacterized DUF497 family protein